MDPYLGEIKLVSFDFAPSGWAFCDGQEMAILQNQALYTLLGTTFGGDGVNNFRLPDFRGRVPVHPGGTLAAAPGATGGEAAHTLAANEIPAHTHAVRASSAVPNAPYPSGNAWAAAARGYAGTPDAAMKSEALTESGADAPHENRQPYLVLNFIIAIDGVYPLRS